MTENQATPEQWDTMKDCRADNFDDGYAACILELRARVEALEAQSQSTPKDRPIRSCPEDGSLLERVQAAICHSYPDDARAAIHAVASWLAEEFGPRVDWIATELEEEAQR